MARNTHFVVWSACKVRIWVRVRVNAVWTVWSVLVAADSCSFMQADIYSLGVLLWEIVTSDVPERGRMRPVKVCPLLLIACLLSASSVVIAQGICQNPPAFSLCNKSSFNSMTHADVLLHTPRISQLSTCTCPPGFGQHKNPCAMYVLLAGRQYLPSILICAVCAAMQLPDAFA